MGGSKDMKEQILGMIKGLQIIDSKVAYERRMKAKQELTELFMYVGLFEKYEQWRRTVKDSLADPKNPAARRNFSEYAFEIDDVSEEMMTELENDYRRGKGMLTI